MRQAGIDVPAVMPTMHSSSVVWPRTGISRRLVSGSSSVTALTVMTCARLTTPAIMPSVDSTRPSRSSGGATRAYRPNMAPAAARHVINQKSNTSR